MKFAISCFQELTLASPLSVVTHFLVFCRLPCLLPDGVVLEDVGGSLPSHSNSTGEVYGSVLVHIKGGEEEFSVEFILRKIL
jgi:hypothetical protein